MRPLNLHRKPLLWCALAVAVVVAGVAFSLWPREPRYEGNPLSYWLDYLTAKGVANITQPRIVVSDIACPHWVWDDHKREKEATAKKAIEALGSRCLPTLLQRLQTRATLLSAFKENTLVWAMKGHLVHRPFVLTSNPPGAAAAEFKRGQAVAALIQLGDVAKPVVPDVIKLAKTDSDPGVRAYALLALESLSPADALDLEQSKVANTAAR